MLNLNNVFTFRYIKVKPKRHRCDIGYAKRIFFPKRRNASVGRGCFAMPKDVGLGLVGLADRRATVAAFGDAVVAGVMFVMIRNRIPGLCLIFIPI